MTDTQSTTGPAPDAGPADTAAAEASDAQAALVPDADTQAVQDLALELLMSALEGPAGDVQPATLDDFTVRRDEHGRVIPRTVEIPGLARTIEVKPITVGGHRIVHRIRRARVAGDDEAAFRGYVELLREHVVSPDLSGLTPEAVLRDWTPYAWDRITAAVLLAGLPRREPELGKDPEGNAPEPASTS